MGTPYVILVRGQSNPFITRAYSWKPNPRVKVWNNALGVDTSVGSAWGAADPASISLATAYADFVAEFDASLDPYVIVLANGSLDIGHFTAGNTFTWQTGTTAPPGSGAIRGNHATPASITQLFISEFDSTGANKRTFPARMNPGHKIRIYDASSVLLAEFTISGTPVDNGVYWTVPVGSVVISGTLTGTVTVASTPDFYRAAKNIVPAALAAIPGSPTTIDLELWWQGESDPDITEARYKAQWGEKNTLSLAESWYPADTKQLIFGISAVWAHSTNMNQWLLDIANASANRFYVDLPTKVGYAWWTDGEVHMIAEGYVAAAAAAAAVFKPGTTHWWNEFKIKGASGFIPVADRALKYGNGAAFVAPSRVLMKADSGRFIRPGKMKKEIVSVSTTSGFSVIKDIEGDPRHVTSPSGKSIGLWADTPAVVHRNHLGAAVLYLGAQQTYRFGVVGNDWTGASGFTNSPYAPCRSSNNTGVEGQYDHRIWLFGVYKPPGNQIVYGVGHHEWYPFRETVDGYPGYNVTGGHKWVTSPIWLKSEDNGNTWTTKPVTVGINNQHRLFLRPEPWLTAEHDMMYGHRHQSNIVRPSDVGFADTHYYFFCEGISLGSNEDTLATSGVEMVRVRDIEDPTTSEFWDGKKWVPRDLSTGVYQGNEGQKPYLFFCRSRYDIYGGQQGSSRMGQALRYHEESGLWTMWGYTGQVAGYACMAVSPSLEHPEWELRGRKMISLAGGGIPSDYIGNRYLNVFDPTYPGQDLNYTLIGNTPILLATEAYKRLRRQTLAISLAA